MKNYIFFSEHELLGGYQRFEPDFFMAQSWHRLAFEPEKIQKHDIILIRHELFEMSLVAQGYSYRDAHIEANDYGYDYQTMADEYYNLLKKTKYEKKQRIRGNNV